MSKIRETRKKLNFTQQKVSDIIGVPIRTLQDWEGERRKPPQYVESLIIEKLERISEERI